MDCLALDGFDLNTAHKLKSKDKKLDSNPGLQGGKRECFLCYQCYHKISVEFEYNLKLAYSKKIHLGQRRQVELRRNTKNMVVKKKLIVTRL